jgi:hypothetical protein
MNALIAGYTRNAAFNAPTITQLNENHAYRYDVLSYDTNGQFFVADVRNSVNSSNTNL